MVFEVICYLGHVTNVMLLHSVMRQGAGSGYTGNEIPDGLDFPLQNVEDC